jgi:subtilisin-like proprotein convertase family protein
MHFYRRLLLLFACLLAPSVLAPTVGYCQSGLRQSLERLDTNEDGEIQPEEITPLARPFLERVAQARRMTLSREYDIEKWQEAARIYYAIQNGVSGERVRPDFGSSIKGFGPEDDEFMVPEFGLAEIKYRYTPDDLEEADESLERYDRNDDGYIDRVEARRGRWTHRDPFEEDYDNDNRLSRLELAQRYARRRQLDGASDELVQKARRVGNGIQPATDRSKSTSSSSYSRRGDSRSYLTTTILGRFDKNRNGRLETDEAMSMGIPPGRIDADRNGELSRDELMLYFNALQDQVGDTSEVIPGWFYELDANRNGQIEMLEFTDEWTDEKAAEFASYDNNNDGILTSAEVLSSAALAGGSYKNTEAEVLPPRKTVISEIEVTDDFVIGDLNVQLSITHTYVSYLDGYLTGPDGQRVELFTGVGRNDDHFEQTTFDDQSTYSILKARPPFKGTFQPEALAKKQPSLSAFNGKSVKGVWQLVIRCSRSERFGMLHSWGLSVTPAGDLLDGAVPTPAADGPQTASVVSNASSKPFQPTLTATSDERRAKIEEQVRQTEGWITQIRSQLSSKDMSDDNREKLKAKMAGIQRYQEHISNGGSREDFKRKVKEDKSEKKDRLKQLFRK